MTPSMWRNIGLVLVKAPQPPLPPDLCKFFTTSGGGPPLLENVQKKYEGFDRVFCTFLRRGGPPPPPRMGKIGQADEALYYSTIYSNSRDLGTAE